MAGISIRDANEADLPVIMEIFNYAVLNTTAILIDKPVDLDNRREWLAARVARGFPVIVSEVDGKVNGYASYGDWRALEGFRNTVEHSVYVHREARGGGVGRTLMEALIARAAAGGVHVMVACIEAENAPSIRLHEKLGFKDVGTFSEVATKFGRWLNLNCMELRVQNTAAS